jgi:hypothetical protein
MSANENKPNKQQSKAKQSKAKQSKAKQQQKGIIIGNPKEWGSQNFFYLWLLLARFHARFHALVVTSNPVPMPMPIANANGASNNNETFIRENGTRMSANPLGNFHGVDKKNKKQQQCVHQGWESLSLSFIAIYRLFDSYRLSLSFIVF